MTSGTSDISTQLTLFSEAELNTCSNFNIKLLGVIMVFIFVLILISSLSSSIMPNNEYYDNLNENQNENINSKYTTFSELNYNDYKSTPLTPPETFVSMMFGQANRYIGIQNNKNTFILDIFCNLLLLNGNPLGETSIIDTSSGKQKYLAYLVNDINDKKDTLFIGELKANSDQVYKLQFISDKVTDLSKYNKIEIVYSNNTEKQTILLGEF